MLYPESLAPLIDRPPGGSRPLAVLVVLMLLLSIAPALSFVGAQDDGHGYLVFRDTLPIGPDLDAVFHVVVPDEVNVLGARLDLYGTTGIVPVTGSTDDAGTHNHSLSINGTHAHQVEGSTGHIHTQNMSGDHDHSVAVFTTSFDLQDARMDATLPEHNHTYDETTWVIDPYSFPPIISNGHDHTADAHGHDANIPLDGDHDHTTEVDGDHDHLAQGTGDHDHTSSLEGPHTHELAPGWERIVDGTRPEQVRITLIDDQGSVTLPDSYGSMDADWHETVDLTGELSSGITEVRFDSVTDGTLEYVLMVEIDSAYGVLTGHGPLGGDGTLEVPIWSPPETLGAQAYLFGSDLPQTVDLASVGGDHTHDAQAEGDHAHNMGSTADHEHQVTGGNHIHNGTVTTAEPPTTRTTPYWNLPGHRHDATWNGLNITGIGDYDYATVQSTDHNHTTYGHDHQVTLNVSGNHSHDIALDDVHSHASDQSNDHSHLTEDAELHSHSLSYHPTATGIGSPIGVRTIVDGLDISEANSGPWDLSDIPVLVDLGITDWTVPHSLIMNATLGPGQVEWVVLLKLDLSVIIASVQGLAGDVLAHLPVIDSVGGASVGVMGNQYIMPLDPSTQVEGVHDHVASMDGNHTHATSMNGSHDHDLLEGDYHSHNLTLDITVAGIQNANGTVGLGTHAHTIGQSAMMTSSDKVVATTGSHDHVTDLHGHDLLWSSLGDHTHSSSLAGNHSHDMVDNGSHSHSMEGGDHSHVVLPGVDHDVSYPYIADVDLRLGETHPGVNLAGDTTSWWEEFKVQGRYLTSGPMETLVGTAGTVGMFSAIVWFSLDSDAPEPVLIEAPDWVRPDDNFQVVIGLTEDTDISTVTLEIEGPITVDGQTNDEANMTITFDCSVPTITTDGHYNISVNASDTAGNKAKTVVGSLGVDGTAPGITFQVGEPNVDVDDDTWVRSTTPIIMNISDALSGPDTLEYAFSTEGPWITYDPVNNTILEGLSDGPVDVLILGTDIAGNTAPVGIIALNVDDTPPEAQVLIEPSSPGSNADEVIASLSSLISFEADDSGAGAVDEIDYMISTNGPKNEWRMYDRAFPVSDVVSSGGVTFNIRWRTEDRLGNKAEFGPLDVIVDSVPPIPSPEGDLTFPDYTSSDPVQIRGNIPGDVAKFYYRTDTGQSGIIDIEPDVSFFFDLPLSEGANILSYALEDRVGNLSPWVIAGTIDLDTVPPEIMGSSPVSGTEGHPTKGLVMVVQFNEPVQNLLVTAKSKGSELDISTEMGPGDATVTISFGKELPASSIVILKLTFEDRAGLEGDGELNFKTGEATGESAMGYIFGLIAGLIIGGLLVFFITFNRKRDFEHPGTDPDLHIGEGIISPERQMGWTPEPEGDLDEDRDYFDDDEEEEEEEEKEEEEEEKEEVEEEKEEVEEEKEEVEEEKEEVEEEKEEEENVLEAEDAEEEPGVEEEDEPEVKEEDGDDELDDLADEIDKLLEDASKP